jgi:signal transduction histidine kinase/ActR/RegA family two-component response regulator
MRNNSYLIIALLLAGLIIGVVRWVSHEKSRSQVFYKNHLKKMVDSGKQFVLNNPERGYQLFDSGYRMAEGHNDSTYMAIFSVNRGVAKFYQGVFKKSLKEFKQSYRITKKALPDSFKLLSKVSNNIAVIYDKTGFKDSALKFYQKSLAVAEKGNLDREKGTIWMNMGNLYLSTNQYQIAINQYLKALDYYKNEDTLSLNRVRTYENIGLAYIELSKPELGLEYLKKGFNEVRDSLPLSLQGNLNGNIAEAYLQMDSFNKARKYNDKALTIQRSTKDSFSIYTAQKRRARIALSSGKPKKALQEAAIARNLKRNTYYYPEHGGLALITAKCHYRLNNLQQALNYGKKEVKRAKSHGDTAQLQDGYQLLAKIYKAGGRLDKAVEAHERSQKFQEAILSTQKHKYVEDLRSYMAFEQQQQQIRILEQKNKIKSLKARRQQNMIYGLGAGLVLLLGAAGFLIKINQSRKKANRSLEHQKQVVQEQKQALEKANEKIRRASKAQSDFITMVSHEIRTPINGLMGMTELLQETNLNKEQEKYLQSIRSSSNALLTVINDVLDLRRTEQGRLVINKHDFDLRNMIHDIDTLMRPVVERKGLDFHVNIDARVPSNLFGDSDRIRQMLINLIGNAMKFTDRGHIELTVEDEGASDEVDNSHWFAFHVKDTGRGIDQATQQRIFQAFEQGESPEYAKNGLGLGLSICQTLSQTMNGKVDLISEPGAGSCFTLRLPLEIPEKSKITQSDDQSGFDKQSEESQQKLGETYPLKILVAEDDQLNQEVVVRFLDKLGYEPSVVYDGIAAVDEVRNGLKPDFILMDIQMPRKDGVTAAQEIQEYYQAGSGPVIVALTADALKGSEDYYRKAGMDDYLTKPFNVNQLRSLIQKWGPDITKQ